MTLSSLLTALRATLVYAALTSFVYPLVVTFLGQSLFPYQADGSLITEGTRILGSELVGQNFRSDRYLWGRPSAVAYDASTSGGSNWGPNSTKLADRTAADALRLGTSASPALLAASGSGLDPHVPPEAAQAQAGRIAQARSVSVDRVSALVDEFTEPRDWGFLGEPRVNVLQFNIALDRRFP